MSGLFEQNSKIGDYTLLRKLATGGMGEIWLAERKGISGFSKRVVIKTILECFADEPSLVDMFLQEGRIAAGLNHPNIAQTYDLGQVGRTYYMAMEYVNGRDLRNILLANVKKKQLVPLNLVLRIAAETCEGLYHAHTWHTPDGQHAGIIHRDISPQNILVTFEGKVKIIDFGIAKAAQSASRTRSGVLKGKYAYMSPEQVRGKQLDPRSDLFSLGVVLYEMLTARRLFKRDSELSTLDAVLESEVPSPKRFDVTVPKEVEDVLFKALARNPEDRFQDARQMQLALEEVMISCKLPASSAHLAAYMDEIFHDSLQYEQELEQMTNSNLMSMMERLPSASGPGPKMERTKPFAPGMSIEEPEISEKRELTRNLLPSVSSGQIHRGGKTTWHWAVIGLLAMILGVASWLLVKTLANPNTRVEIVDAGKTTKEAEGLSIKTRQDAKVQQTQAHVDSSMDAGTKLPKTDEKKTEGDLALGLNLSDKPDDNKAHGKTKRPSYGWVSISTAPSATIYKGGKILGVGSVKKLKLRPGRHKLLAKLPNGAQKVFHVKVVAGKTASTSVKFVKGKLRIVVHPWADVWVDGKSAGQTPMGALELMEGPHKVQLKNATLGKDIQKTVFVKPGKETSLRMDWR